MLKNDKFNLTLTVCIIVLTTIMIICGLFVYKIAKDTEKNDTNKQTTNNFNISNIIGLNTSKLDSVEIASTPEEIERGLMYRKSLCQTCGMLFSFPDSQKRSFWMKNTPIPLDIIFIDENYKVLNIAKNTTPYSTESLFSEGKVRYVLEVNAGWSAKNNLKKGDLIEVEKYLRDGKKFEIVQS